VLGVVLEVVEDAPGLARIRDRARQAPQDEQLAALVATAKAAVADLPPGDPSDDGLIACPEFLAGDRVIRTIAMAARFDSVLEVTLDELRIELLYPADAVAEAFFRRARRPRTAFVSTSCASSTTSSQPGTSSRIS
jgi:hypothetical protein